MDNIHRYIYQLDLIKELIERDEYEANRLALILLDNTFELISVNYIKANVPSNASIHSSQYFNQKLKTMSKSVNFIDQEKEGIVLLIHYYRNKLYHSGDMDKINSIYSSILKPYFNFLNELILRVTNFNSYSSSNNSDYKLLFQKYLPNVEFKIGNNKEIIEKTLDKLKYQNVNFSKEILIQIIKEISDEITNGISMIFDLAHTMNLTEVLTESFLRYSDINHYEKSESKEFIELLKNFQSINYLEDLVNNLDENNNSFYSNYLDLLKKLLFVEKITSDLICDAESEIENRMDERRLNE